MVANSSFKQELLLREYGRNVQNIVSYILTIEDRAQRSRSAQALVNLMGRLNPSVNTIQDAQQKLWNHLFVMSDGQLDVDAPYQLSAMEYLNEKPQIMEVPQQMPKFKHYGKNVEALVQKVSEMTDPEEQRNAIISLGKLMKALYKTYNKDTTTDPVILEEMRTLSKGKLNIELPQGDASTLFDSSANTKQPMSYPQPQQNQNNNKFKKNNYQNNRQKNKN